MRDIITCVSFAYPTSSIICAFLLRVQVVSYTGRLVPKLFRTQVGRFIPKSLVVSYLWSGRFIHKVGRFVPNVFVLHSIQIRVHVFRW